MTHKFSFLNIAMLLVAFLFFQTETKAAIGDWTIYSSYYEANKVVGLNNYVFVLCDGRLYSYDKDDTSVETYDKAHLLNGNNIYGTRLEFVVTAVGNVEPTDSYVDPVEPDNGGEEESGKKKGCFGTIEVSLLSMTALSIIAIGALFIDRKRKIAR